jgi:hypothetical protein
MANLISFRLLGLQLVADGTGTGATGGTADGGTTASGATGVTETAAVSQKKGVKSNPLANVKYGKQESAQTADVQEESTAANEKTVVESKPDRNAEFEALIKGDYKDLYDAKVASIVQQRLKGSKEIESKFNALSPVLDILGQKYGVDPTDVEALNKAIQEDDSYYADEAMSKGMSVEELKRIKKIERENAEFRKAERERTERAGQKKVYAEWLKQADAAKQIYPSLDLATEAKNPNFMALLKNGIDVGTAYMVIHKDEVIPAAMQFAAQTAQKSLANNLMTNKARPVENGNSSQSAPIVKSDVSQLNRKDLAEIRRRVANGERISFG